MILRQYLHVEPVVAASYLVGCGAEGIAAVIDPLPDFDRYERDAEATGMAIRFVVDTHVHADHLSGGPRLAERIGADYVLHESSPAELDFRPVRDFECLDLGNVSLEVWHTPGHTPEHISLIAIDRTRAVEPWAIFTGHTLMVGDMGRTELASTPEVGARALFESARRLKALPDYVQVLPGAFSGSVCGRGLSGNPVSTIGYERRHSRAFGVDDRDAFLRLMTQEIPPRPPQADETRARNLGLALARP